MLTFATTNKIEGVPVEWIYHHYLKINQPLKGQLVKIRSFINTDSTPSLCLYPKNGVYRWKDFSSGEGGSHVDLVISQAKKCGITLSYGEACKTIVNEYNNYLSVHGVFKASKVEAELTDYSLEVDYEHEKWAEEEEIFWNKRFNIKEKIADHFNIYPLKWYQLKKNYGNYIHRYRKIEEKYIYGYFTDSGKLYQIYQPYSKDMKFIKLMSYIQGMDQLEPTKGDILIIGSSMKDIASMYSLGLPRLQFIAPPSESTYISKDTIELLKSQFPYIFTLFDNDKAGIKAMKRYEELYNIPYIYMPFEKDVAEMMDMNGPNVLEYELITRINKKLNNEQSKICSLWDAA